MVEFILVRNIIAWIRLSNLNMNSAHEFVATNERSLDDYPCDLRCRFLAQ
jgi:hypothetical protein